MEPFFIDIKTKKSVFAIIKYLSIRIKFSTFFRNSICPLFIVFGLKVNYWEEDSAPWKP